MGFFRPAPKGLYSLGLPGPLHFCFDFLLVLLSVPHSEHFLVLFPPLHTTRIIFLQPDFHYIIFQLNIPFRLPWPESLEIAGLLIYEPRDCENRSSCSSLYALLFLCISNVKELSAVLSWLSWQCPHDPFLHLIWGHSPRLQSSPL